MIKSITSIILVVLFGITKGRAQTIIDSVRINGSSISSLEDAVNFCKKELEFSENEVQNLHYSAKDEVDFLKQSFKNNRIFKFNTIKSRNFIIKKSNQKIGLGIIELNYASPMLAKKVYHIFKNRKSRFLNTIALTRYTAVIENNNVLIYFSENPFDEFINKLFTDLGDQKMTISFTYAD